MTSRATTAAARAMQNSIMPFWLIEFAGWALRARSPAPILQRQMRPAKPVRKPARHQVACQCPGHKDYRHSYKKFETMAKEVKKHG
jgi:hypothetical protein